MPCAALATVTAAERILRMVDLFAAAGAAADAERIAGGRDAMIYTSIKNIM
jgi:hypothetical protein